MHTCIYIIEVKPIRIALPQSYFSTVPSSPPQNYTIEALDSRTILLEWNPPDIEEQNGIVRQYLARITETETETEFQVVTNETSSLNITGLHPYYTYQVSIAAVTIGVGPFTEVKTVRNPEDGKFAL